MRKEREHTEARQEQERGGSVRRRAVVGRRLKERRKVCGLVLERCLE